MCEPTVTLAKNLQCTRICKCELNSKWLGSVLAYSVTHCCEPGLIMEFVLNFRNLYGVNLSDLWKFNSASKGDPRMKKWDSPYFSRFVYNTEDLSATDFWWMCCYVKMLQVWWANIWWTYVLEQPVYEICNKVTKVFLPHALFEPI